MANAQYITGRWALDGLRRRPQAVLWADNFGFNDEETSLAVPLGVEGENFLILSDHNRSELAFSQERIENRQRMINGSMRSYHIADKTRVSWDWEMLPSRSFNKDPNFNQQTGKPTASGLTDYTADGGAGGVELLDWYENHQGPFWMMLAYDKYNDFSGPEKFDYLSQYNQIIQVYFASFDYNVVKRGGTNHDMWNISVTLEEV